MKSILENKEVISRGNIAIYDEEDERVFSELKAEMDKAYLSYQKGNYIPASEMEKKWMS